MTPGLRPLMAWFHGWSGVIAGWLLYMMFVTGSAAVFKDEISAWMTPETARTVLAPDVIDRAADRLGQAAPDASSWTISLPHSRDPAVRLSWRMERDGTLEREVLASDAGQVATPRDTRGGDFFYRLHYRFDQPGRSAWGYAVAAGVLMLAILVAGIIAHKRFFSDFYNFRPQATKQRSWLDAHLLLGVLLLPFHLMITYTGLVPIISTVMPFGMIANYGNEERLSVQMFDVSAAREAFAEERSDTPSLDRSGIAAPPPVLRPIIDKAEAEWGKGTVRSITIRNPGDSNAVVELTRSPRGVVSHRQTRLYYRADGAQMEHVARSRPVAQTQAFLYGLHMARFSDIFLRWAYFIAGLGSSALIATGLILWSVKRRSGRQVPGRWDLFVERLNAGMIVGLPIAMCAFFHGNRLLPLDIAERALVEVRLFFAVWIATALLSAILPRRASWAVLTALLSAAALALPFVNALTTDRGLATSLAQDDWLMAGFDISFLAAGVMAGALAWYLHKRRPAPERQAQTHRVSA